MPALCEKYHIFPDADDWKGRILLLESSEEKTSPIKYRQALEYLKERGVFQMISGVLVGKPMDDPSLPVLCNVNIGHATPRCIIPFGVNASVDADKQVIQFG